eukprot:TRINITY_DN9314_c0_g2_i1.p1 TRINITY_DN9314_c0_g2~~TRINITY_DN9314_c0_g2_i1.p1  ORF type:complete len:955 (-),score=390.20 TRINITY_DN9314_c0_g2_i1:252-2777(-)
MMIVNLMQRDLQSNNKQNIVNGLSAVAKLLTADMIPAVSNLVIPLLRHEDSLVRKKAIMVLHRFHRLDSKSVADMNDQFRRVLCDKDPAVMGASLHMFLEIIKKNPHPFKDLIPSFVSILKQIKDHALLKEFDYKNIPAPWIQMTLLKILAQLGKADQAASEGMYEVLHDVMRRADTGINIGYAVLFECIRTVTTIYPNTVLLDAAASSISRFLSSDSNNRKYLGVTCLAEIVKDHPRYTAAHQLAVLDCLEDSDDALKRKTLSLLYRMCNSRNVEAIVSKLVEFLKASGDVFLRKELVGEIVKAAEGFASSNSWYLRTMFTVLEVGAELCTVDIANNMISLLGQGVGESEEEDEALRREAVDMCIPLLENKHLPSALAQVLMWVLGEYGYLSQTKSVADIMDQMCTFITSDTMEGPEKCVAVSAVMKLAAQIGALTDSAEEVMKNYSRSRDVSLQQRCLEALALSNNASALAAVLPVDASAEEITVDVNMSMLDGIVAIARANGAPEWKEPTDSFDDLGYDGQEEVPGLRFDAYEEETAPAPVDIAAPATAPEVNAQNTGVKQVWGAAGFQGDSLTGVSGIQQQQEELAAKQREEERQKAMSMGLPPVENNYPVDENAVGVDPSYKMASERYNLGTPTSPSKPKNDARTKMAAALFGGFDDVPPPPAPIAPTPPSVTQTAPSQGGMMWGAPQQQVATTAPVSSPAVPTQQIEEDDIFGAPSVSTTPVVPSVAEMNLSVFKPLVIPTSQFGQRWQTPGLSQHSIVLPSTATSLQDLFGRIGNNCGLHVIEIKPAAGICAGTSNNDFVLIHGSLSMGTATLTARVSNDGLVEELRNVLSKNL